jgi:membrane protease YdiL (CAAX protease family)
LNQPDPDLQINENLNFTGTWETSGRSLTAAVLAGLLGIGVIYSYGQSLLAFLLLLTQGKNSAGYNEGENFLKLLAQNAELTKNPIRVSLFCSQILLMLLPTLWIVKRWHTDKVTHYVRLDRVPFRLSILAMLITALFLPANLYISSFIAGGMNIPKELIEINQKLFTASNTTELLLLFIIVGVTPAFCEEILFRGYAQRTLERIYDWKSILIVGLIFGLFHLQPLSLFTLSGLGILFGYFYYTSRSLIPSIAAHFTNNALIVLLLYLPLTKNGFFLDTPRIEIVLVTLPIAMFLLYIFHTFMKKHNTTSK